MRDQMTNWWQNFSKVIVNIYLNIYVFKVMQVKSYIVLFSRDILSYICHSKRINYTHPNKDDKRPVRKCNWQSYLKTLA